MARGPSRELEAAWTAALDASRADERPWRVLSDMLLAEGDDRGELLRLELDAERGPLTLAAQNRLKQLRRELNPLLCPPDSGHRKTTLWRTVPIEAAVEVLRCRYPTDRRWRTVRRLVFEVDQDEVRDEAWRRSPLAGGQLERVEHLERVAEGALLLLLGSRPMPRLRRLEVLPAKVEPRGAPHLATDTFWSSLCARHPALRDIDLASGVDEERALRWLELLVQTPVQRVAVPATIAALSRVDDWRRRRGPAFSVTVRLNQVEAGAELTLEDRALHLTGPLEAVRAARATLPLAWPRHPRLVERVEARPPPPGPPEPR